MSESTESKSVTIDTGAAQPHHSFVEKIHTPHHGNPHANMSAEDWDAEKHAHIAASVKSPHGNVVREPTPVGKPIDCGFDGASSEASPVKQAAKKESSLFFWNTSATVIACAGVAAALVMGNLRYSA